MEKKWLIFMLFIPLFIECSNVHNYDDKLAKLKENKAKAIYNAPFIYYFANYFEMPPNIDSAVNYYNNIFPFDSINIAAYKDPFSLRGKNIKYIKVMSDEDNAVHQYICLSNGFDFRSNKYKDTISETELENYLFYNTIKNSPEFINTEFEIEKKIRPSINKDLYLERVNCLDYYISGAREVHEVSDFIELVKTNKLIKMTVNLVGIKLDKKNMFGLDSIRVDDFLITFDYKKKIDFDSVNDTLTIIGKIVSMDSNHVELVNCIFKE